MRLTPRCGNRLSAADIEHDQAEVRRILGVVGGDRLDGVTFSDRLDALVLHPLLGPVILAVILFLVFQAVFAWAQVPMDAIKAGVAAFGDWLGAALPTVCSRICWSMAYWPVWAACLCFCRRSSSCSSLF